MTVSAAGGSGKVVKRPTLVGSVLPPLLFLLVCGIVGPIFVAIGISSDGSDPDAGWMLWIGLGITVMDIVIGLLIGRHRYRSAQKRYRLSQRGKPARAQVLSFDATNVEINDQPLMKLSLRIAGDDVASFDVEDKIVIPEYRVPLLYAGSLPVLVDPETHEWEIDWDAAPPVSAGFQPVVADARTPAERLAELDDLLKRDLVSREEYDATRARILDAI